MKKTLTIFGVILVASFIFFACINKKSDVKSTEDAVVLEKNEKELRAANDQYYIAINAMFTGNLEPMKAIWSHGSKITDMGPFGGCLIGWDSVGAEYGREAEMKLGGKVGYKDLHIYAGTNMGYTVCVEEGENMSADGKPVLVSFRATNIFHLENGEWKMVLHHNDFSTQLVQATQAKAK